MSDIVDVLYKQAVEIAIEGIPGWGNTMTSAAEEIAQLRAELEQRYTAAEHERLVARGQELNQNYIAKLSAELDALKAQRGEAVVPAQWSKSLGSCWPFDEEDPQGDWSIGTIDEDGNRYEVMRVEASQYDADGESQKIAEAIVKLWGSAAPAQPVAPATPPATDALVEALEQSVCYLNSNHLNQLASGSKLHQMMREALSTYRASQRKESTCR